VVVHRGGRQALIGEAALPGQDVPFEEIPYSLVSVRFLIEGSEALEVEGDLVGDLLRADPDDGQSQVAGDPGRQRLDRVRRSPNERLKGAAHLS
jgi:hypothetical protein